MTETEQRVVVELVIAAPVPEVWRALREPEEIRRWFGWEYDGLAEEIDEIFLSDATRASDEEHVLVAGGDRIVLEPRGRETVVRVTRAAPAGGASPDTIYDEIDEGWLTFLQQLRLALERHAGERRWTLRLSGRRRGAGSPALAEALGLEPAAALGAGERYDAVTAVGEPLSGEVWFSREGVTGLTVDAWGDGLLVLGGQPAQTKPPHGSVNALITVYGLDDGERTRLRERWTGWWESHFDEPEAVGGA
jgi:hypothetical protein